MRLMFIKAAAHHSEAVLCSLCLLPEMVELAALVHVYGFPLCDIRRGFISGKQSLMCRQSRL